MSKLFEELKRRNVIKAAIAYAVVAWVVLQVLSLILPNVEAPEWVMKTLTILAIIGFPVWIFISWVYEVTPEGLKKTAQVSADQSISATTNKRLNVLILVGLVLAIAVGFINKPTLGLTNSNNNLVFGSSIAVLPFDDMSSGGDTQWFCDGITEDILTNLSKLKGLKVISRTSTERYKNTDKSIPEIAAELGVSYLVEGSVRKHEDKIIITAQLIDANDQHIWAESYNDDFNEVFKIQQDVSRKIVNQLHIAITPEEEKIMNTSPTNNVEAYQLVLKGRNIVLNITEAKDLEESNRLYKKAISLDPNYAEAYAELAYSNLMQYFWNSNDETYLKPSRANIDKALLLNPNTGMAYITRAIMHDEVNDGWEQTDKDYERALIINPNDAMAHFEYGLHNDFKPDEDLKKYLFHITKAQELDPLSSIINKEKVEALYKNGLYDEAESHIKKIKNIITENQFYDLSAKLESFRNSDWNKGIDYYFKELEKKPNNRYLLRSIGESYDGILNDDANSVKYLKRAYQADSSHFETARSYHNILSENGQFEEAEALFKTANYQNIMTELQKRLSKFYYYYHQGNYNQANLMLEDSLMLNRITENIIVQAQFGNDNIVYELLKSNRSSTNSAFAFAILIKRDSMYYYLNQTDVNPVLVNSRREFDPYRNEDRYKAFLKRSNYPIFNQAD